MKLIDIGNTPFLELFALAGSGNRFFSKCEFMNPTGSHKDRTYLSIVGELEFSEIIRPGMTLVDCSTGNGGAALAWIGREKGYQIKIFMPEGMTRERKEQIVSFGAEIIETPKDEFLSGAVSKAREYVAGEGGGNTFFLDQASNLLNKKAWLACGEEIVVSLQMQAVVPEFFYLCHRHWRNVFQGSPRC
ncbi:pyridoxal-phosphate dependent enzyme [Pseudomonas asplenii]|uniref:pyridoxal-phosphate dependent enzyme n=1 Tax=Pseudomonas asplenii TaxID=53407 RepID=UPI00192BFB5A|nr:pyridoxal-phosphate dependent enzyme [Pseudomonas fuscovaginae]